MEPQTLTLTDTIAAIATPHGEGGIAVIRISGPEAVGIVSKIWRGKNPGSFMSHTAHLGHILQEDGTELDEVVMTVFRAPNSYTGEDTVELSLHGSRWIQREAINRLVQLGARPAGPGEFTQRAFMNGRMDLAQAEGVADLISAGSKAAHRLAMQQMSGRFSKRLNELRNKLLHFASMLELELDFSEEDVEFADRKGLIDIAEETLATVNRLADSYSSGRAFREGVPVAIAGAPNAGKSTLLNRLLDDEKAIVSDIPGTTRDVIEDTREIGGTLFRFFDTAGLRDTDNTVEQIGIQRAKDHINRAAIVLWVMDASEPLQQQYDTLRPHIERLNTARHFLLLNKSDKPVASELTDFQTESVSHDGVLYFPEKPVIIKLSAKTGEGIETLTEMMCRAAKGDHNPDSELIITNARHYGALRAGAAALDRAIAGLLDSLPTDLVAQDVRQAIHSIGEVTGAVTPTHILTNIFSHFCIGK